MVVVELLLDLFHEALSGISCGVLPIDKPRNVLIAKQFWHIQQNIGLNIRQKLAEKDLYDYKSV